jgi:hypothetical protein
MTFGPSGEAASVGFLNFLDVERFLDFVAFSSRGFDPTHRFPRAEVDMTFTQNGKKLAAPLSTTPKLDATK